MVYRESRPCSRNRTLAGFGLNKTARVEAAMRGALVVESFPFRVDEIFFHTVTL